MRYGMVIDLTKCLGCQACTLPASKERHSSRRILDQGAYFRNRQVSQHKNRLPTDPVHALCGTGLCGRLPDWATEKQPNGIVTVDPDKCIGCRYCMAACPIKRPHFQLWGRARSTSRAKA